MNSQQQIKKADHVEAIRNALPYFLAGISYAVLKSFSKLYKNYAVSPFTLETVVTKSYDKYYRPTAEELPFDPTVEPKVSDEQVEALKNFLLENDRRFLRKKANVIGESFTTFFSGPLAPLVALPSGALVGSAIMTPISKALEKDLLRNYLKIRRQEYLEENQKLINLINKIKNDTLGLADILALSESVRKEIAKDLYNRTGYDYSKLLGLSHSLSDAVSESNSKSKSFTFSEILSRLKSQSSKGSESVSKAASSVKVQPKVENLPHKKEAGILDTVVSGIKGLYNLETKALDNLGASQLAYNLGAKAYDVTPKVRVPTMEDVGNFVNHLAYQTAKGLGEYGKESSQWLWDTIKPVAIPAAGIASLLLGFLLVSKLISNRGKAVKLVEDYKDTFKSWRDVIESQVGGEAYPPYYIPRITAEPTDVKRIRQELFRS